MRLRYRYILGFFILSIVVVAGLFVIRPSILERFTKATGPGYSVNSQSLIYYQQLLQLRVRPVIVEYRSSPEGIDGIHLTDPQERSTISVNLAAQNNEELYLQIYINPEVVAEAKRNGKQQQLQNVASRLVLKFLYLRSPTAAQYEGVSEWCQAQPSCDYENLQIVMVP